MTVRGFLCVDNTSDLIVNQEFERLPNQDLNQKG